MSYEDTNCPCGDKKERDTILDRWEAYRSEMIGFEARMRDLSKKFLAIPAYKEAAECAMRADAMRFIIGRMPNN